MARLLTHSHIPLFLLCALLLGLSACSSVNKEKGPMSVSAHILEAQKARSEGRVPDRVKVGRPYHIKSIQYQPHYNPRYREEGIASWYGPNFHGKSTANGEEYNQYDLTAAHRTLPLPSLVRVENLENGKSLIVRVNDRGPYSRGRIIDLSRRSAELLGSRANGVARVRVTLLEQETRQLWAALDLRVPSEIPSDAAGIMYARAAPDDTDDGPRAKLVAFAEAEPAPLTPVDTSHLPEVLPPPGETIHAVAAVDVTPPLAPVPVLEHVAIEPLAEVAEIAPAPPAQPIKTLHWTVMADASQEDVAKVARQAPRAEPAITQAHPAPVMRYIQAAAYSDQDNARKAADRLAGFGNVTLEPVSIGQKRLYRVRLGPLAPHQQPERIQTQLLDLGFTDARLVY